jgi:WD40 repeat protein
MILTVDEDDNAHLWDGRTGAYVHELKLNTGVWAQGLACFMPSGDQVLTASGSHVTLWSSRTGERLPSGLDVSGTIHRIALRPDGARVVLAGETNLATLWDLKTGKMIATLEGHEDPIAEAEFSPDGERIATVSTDRTVRLWDGSTGQPIAVLRGKDLSIRNVIRISPDSEHVAFATDDDVAHVLWIDRSITGFISAARETLPEPMSPEDEQKYFLNPKSSSTSAN